VASGGSQTALALAARRADLDMVNAILSAGTDVDSVDADGWSALRSAAWGGHLAVVSALLAAGLLSVFLLVIRRPYLSNGRAIGMVVIRLSFFRLSVADVLWLNGARYGLGCY